METIPRNSKYGSKIIEIFILKRTCIIMKNKFEFYIMQFIIHLISIIYLKDSYISIMVVLWFYSGFVYVLNQ